MGQTAERLTYGGDVAETETSKTHSSRSTCQRFDSHARNPMGAPACGLATVQPSSESVSVDPTVTHNCPAHALPRWLLQTNNNQLSDSKPVFAPSGSTTANQSRPEDTPRPGSSSSWPSTTSAPTASHAARTATSKTAAANTVASASHAARIAVLSTATAPTARSAPRVGSGSGKRRSVRWK